MRMKKLRVGMKYLNECYDVVTIIEKTSDFSGIAYIDDEGRRYFCDGESHTFLDMYKLVTPIPKYSFRQLESGALRVVNNYNNNAVIIIDKHYTKDLFELLEEKIG